MKLSDFPTTSLVAETQQVWVDFRLATIADDSPIPYGMLGEKNQSGHCFGTSHGKILWIAAQPESLPDWPHVEWIRGEGKLLTPGLIDSHTHLVFGGNRADEWERRLLGESYQSISASGGGILSTVRATRRESEESLFESASLRLQTLMNEGVTTVEIKSGYGLDLETELKMLRVAKQLGVRHGVDVEPTLLAAHALPPEFAGRADDYIQHICDDMIPACRNECTAVDAFCESIAFSVSQTTRVLQSAMDHGLKVKLHAEQLSYLGSAVVAARMGAVSVDHIEYLRPRDCSVLKETSTVATLLPGAFYFLKEKQSPPTADLIAAGVPIAVATDFNPGSSPILSLRTVANMACLFFGLTPEQAFRGMTINAAKALGIADRCGSIEVGKDADFAIWEVNSPAEIVYQIGGNPCVATYKRGKRVV